MKVQEELQIRDFAAAQREIQKLLARRKLLKIEVQCPKGHDFEIEPELANTIATGFECPICEKGD